jgi:hypothetical protein
VILPYLWQIPIKIRLGGECGCGGAKWPFGGIKLFTSLHIIKWSNLHISKEWNDLQIFENPINFVQTNFLFLIQPRKSIKIPKIKVKNN